MWNCLVPAQTDRVIDKIPTPSCTLKPHAWLVKFSPAFVTLSRSGHFFSQWGTTWSLWNWINVLLEFQSQLLGRHLAHIWPPFPLSKTYGSIKNSCGYFETCAVHRAGNYVPIVNILGTYCRTIQRVTTVKDSAQKRPSLQQGQSSSPLGKFRSQCGTTWSVNQCVVLLTWFQLTAVSRLTACTRVQFRPKKTTRLWKNNFPFFITWVQCIAGTFDFCWLNFAYTGRTNSALARGRVFGPKKYTPMPGAK
jgi:hypothetical protein